MKLQGIGTKHILTGCQICWKSPSLFDIENLNKHLLQHQQIFRILRLTIQYETAWMIYTFYRLVDVVLLRGSYQEKVQDMIKLFKMYWFECNILVFIASTMMMMMLCCSCKQDRYVPQLCLQSLQVNKQLIRNFLFGNVKFGCCYCATVWNMSCGSWCVLWFFSFRFLCLHTREVKAHTVRQRWVGADWRANTRSFTESFGPQACVDNHERDGEGLSFPHPVNTAHIWPKKRGLIHVNCQTLLKKSPYKEAVHVLYWCIPLNKWKSWMKKIRQWETDDQEFIKCLFE